MVMNSYILFTVSLPEAALNIILFLLFAGEREKLKINKLNVIRYFITLVLMLVATEIIRPNAPNVTVNMFLHTFAYTIIFMLVYRVNFRYALLSISFILLIYSMVENSYVPYIIVYVSKGMENFSKQYLMYPIYSLPIRIAQFISICFFWKHEILLVTKINKLFHKIFIITTLILIFVEYLFMFIFYTYYDKMPLAHQIAFSLALCLMAIVFNLLLFKLIYNAVYGIVRKGYKHYSEFEEDVKHAFNEIQTMLKGNDVEQAIKLIDELNGNKKDINNMENSGGEEE